MLGLGSVELESRYGEEALKELAGLLWGQRSSLSEMAGWLKCVCSSIMIVAL